MRSTEINWREMQISGSKVNEVKLIKLVNQAQ